MRRGRDARDEEHVNELIFSEGKFVVFEEELEHQKIRDELLSDLTQAQELAQEFNVHVEEQAPALNKASDNITHADDSQKDALYIAADIQKDKASKYRNRTAAGMAAVGGLVGIVAGPIGVAIGVGVGAALGGGMGQVATSKVRSGIDKEVGSFERRREMGEKYDSLVKHGWMYKTGNLNSNYKKRYFYLFVDRLEYFEKEQLTDNDEPNGIAEFSATSRVWRVPQTTSREFAFSLVVSEERGRVFSFAAEDEHEMNDWIQAIGKALDTFIKTLASGSEKKENKATTPRGEKIEGREEEGKEVYKYGGPILGMSVCLRAIVTPSVLNVALLEKIKWMKEKDREVLKGKGLLYDWKETSRMGEGELVVMSQGWGRMLDHPQRIVVVNTACKAKNHWHKVVSECCVCALPEVQKEDVQQAVSLVHTLLQGAREEKDDAFVWDRVSGDWLQARATELLQKMSNTKNAPTDFKYCTVKSTGETVLTSDPSQATAFIVRAAWPSSFFDLPQSSKKPMKMVRPVFGFEHQQTGKILTSNTKEILMCTEAHFERGEQFCMVADGVMVAVARTKRYLSVRESDQAIQLVSEPSTSLRLWAVDSTTVIRANKPKSRHFKEQKSSAAVAEEDQKKLESAQFWKPVNDAALALNMQVSDGHSEIVKQGETMDAMAHRLAMQQDTAETTHRILSKGLFSKTSSGAAATTKKFRRSNADVDGDEHEPLASNDDEFGPSGLTAGVTLDQAKKTVVKTSNTLGKQNQQLDEITKATEEVTLHVDRNYQKMTGKHIRTAPDA